MSNPLQQAPLSLVDESFQAALAAKALQPTACLSELPRVWNEREELIRRLRLDEPEGFFAVPSLNDSDVTDRHAPHSLVRYRCMAQDMFDSEFFCGVYSVLDATGQRHFRTAKYRDAIPEAAAAGGPYRLDPKSLQSHEGLFARSPVYAVPLPGETAWARQAATAQSSVVLCGNQSVPPTNPTSPAQPAAQQEATKKRGREEGGDVDMAADEDGVDADGFAVPACPAGPNAPRKSGRVESAAGKGEQGGPRTADEFGLNLPLGWEEGGRRPVCCLLKFYDQEEERQDKQTAPSFLSAAPIRLNDAIEVVGVLAVQPEGVDSTEQGPIGSCDEDGFSRDACNPSSSLVPRLHVIAYRHLGSWHPLVAPHADLAPQFAAMLARGPAPSVADLRAALLRQLLPAVCGDATAAEYVLLSLLASTFKQTEARSLGRFSLSLGGFPNTPGATEPLRRTLEALHPRVAYVPLSIGVLDRTGMAPRKDFALNRLVSGALQLPKGTVLLLDETALQAGRLQKHGVANLKAISDMLNTGRVQYDFVNYALPFALDASPILLSTTNSLFKNCDVRVALQPADPQLPPAHPPAVDGGLLQQLRTFIGLCAEKSDPVSIEQAVNEHVSSFFVEARQRDTTVGAETFHRWVTLARLAAFSHGEPGLSIQRWDEVMAMETARIARLPKPTATAKPAAQTKA